MNDDPFQKPIAGLRLFYPGSPLGVQPESEIPATADSGPPHQFPAQGTPKNLPGIFWVGIGPNVSTLDHQRFAVYTYAGSPWAGRSSMLPLGLAFSSLGRGPIKNSVFEAPE